MHRSAAVSDRPARLEALGLVALVAALAVLVWWWLSPEAVMRLMSESGPIEEATAVLYFLVAACVCIASVSQAPAVALPLCLVLCGFGARELDLHKAFTDVSVLKLSFYLGDAPPAHKLMALALVLPVLAAMLHLLMRHGANLWRGLRQGHPVATTAAVFCVTLVVSKLLDRSRMVLLEDFGIALSASTTALLLALEETLELALPLLVLIGLLRQRRPARAAHPFTTQQIP